MIANPDPTEILDSLYKVLEHLTTDCQWPTSAIHIFGFAQGGSVTAELALQWSRNQTEASKKALGSIVSVAGPLLSFPTLAERSATPCLLWRRSAEAGTAAPAFRKGFTNAEEVIMRTPGRQGMPRDQSEWLPIMKWVL